jgi:hypothetical protein
MATIVTREGKGSALTWTEGDANITNLNNDKIELTDLSVGAEGTASGDGAISYDNTTGVFTYTPPVIPSAGIANVVEDTTPQLGGELDGQGNTLSNVNFKDYKETVFSLGTTSGTITPNVANGNVQSITLNGNLTFSAFTSPEAGQSLTLIINTGGTGRTLTSTMKFAGGSKTISTTATTDIITVFYDGSNYWASLSKDFI